MHFYRTGVSERSAKTLRSRHAGMQLRAAASVMLTLASCLPSGFSQQAAPNPPKTSNASGLPAAPAVTPTEPFSLRDTERDFSKPYAGMLNLPWKPYSPTKIAPASFANSVRLDNLVKDGKIYLSLSDALALAIENNYDIAIARYNLDIADTDILRARAGAPGILGAPSGLVTGTLGGSTSTLATGGGPGGTTVGAGGAGSGASGLSLTTSGAGPTPENLDPSLTGTIQFDRNHTQDTSIFSPAASTNTNTYNFTYNQGFVPGTALALSWNNNRVVNSSPLTSYFPNYNSSFKATVTQQLLQGFGIFVNRRFMYQALNDRRITDAGFRQQILYTVNQVESIYWGLVSAYENVQSKDRALNQSTELLGETQKELQIGTMAPLDVVNAQQTVATDKQNLVSAQNDLKYQQMIMKQAIARNLNDPALESADIIPTDRVTIEELPEESQPVDDLVKVAFQQRPELEEAVLTLRNDEITLKGARNALLPTLNVFGYYGATITGGPLNPNCNFFGEPCYPPGSQSTVPTGYGSVLSDLVNSTAPDKGVGFSLTVPLRNREAQSQQARSLMEYRQAELRLEQLYTQIRMQVVNAQFALTNDRAQVLASRAAQDYAQQSLDAEEKKLHLGASTTANVLQQERNLATAEYNMIHAETSYANHRASLYQTLATTLQHYGINLNDTASGVVQSAPAVPGLEPAKNTEVAPTTPPPAQQ
jgi:outer membrane protein